MDMLRAFFKISDEDTGRYFKDKDIWKCGEEYDSFFGFTGEEVHELLEYYGVSEKEEELREWYDGYLFGQQEIYNPWSVINYVSRGCTPQAYWVNTGKNEILDDVLKRQQRKLRKSFFHLCREKK